VKGDDGGCNTVLRPVKNKSPDEKKIIDERSAHRYGSGSPTNQPTNQPTENMNTTPTTAAQINSLTVTEAQSVLETTCVNYARQADHGCKLIGLLRGKLVSDGTAPADAFLITVAALQSGGMEETKARGTANNGKNHETLAEFVLKDGTALKESHFYACGVRDAKRLAKFLAAGGDDAIVVVNRLKLTDAGAYKRGALDKLLPAAAEKAENKNCGDIETDDAETIVEDGTGKTAYARAIILLTSVQALMREMTAEERESIQDVAAEFILG
jgi:hypothetical protein